MILVHVCCTACSCQLFDFLKKQNFQATAYYYNPNIHPKAEYDRRLSTFQNYFSGKNKLIIGNWEPRKYFAKIKNAQKRCTDCYRLRLEQTFLQAKKMAIPAVTSTLLVSKLQNKKEIIKIGQQLAKKYKLEFIDQDFDKLFDKSLLKARQEKLYLQSYCGCIYSLTEKYVEKYKISF